MDEAPVLVGLEHTELRLECTLVRLEHMELCLERTLVVPRASSFVRMELVAGSPRLELPKTNCVRTIPA